MWCNKLIWANVSRFLITLGHPSLFFSHIRLLFLHPISICWQKTSCEGKSGWGDGKPWELKIIHHCSIPKSKYSTDHNVHSLINFSVHVCVASRQFYLKLIFDAFVPLWHLPLNRLYNYVWLTVARRNTHPCLSLSSFSRLYGFKIHPMAYQLQLQAASSFKSPVKAIR